jgi:tRNA(Ile2) C34 agmatinyltransferase TiaS
MIGIQDLKMTKANERVVEFGVRCSGCRTFCTLKGKGPFKCRRCDRPLPVVAKPVEQKGQPVLHYRYEKTEK